LAAAFQTEKGALEPLGIESVGLSEQVDTSAPTGKMVFTVLGAVAELGRSLIVERVKAGLRNAKAEGRKLGRPRKVVDATRIPAMRALLLNVCGHNVGPDQPLSACQNLSQMVPQMLYVIVH
jgi:DNA invertase Pin-like site-specific DNA recombinase